MKNKINKALNLILLLSMLNGNIFSMQEKSIEPETQAIKLNQDVQQELGLLGLPAEVIEYILYQIIKPYEDKIKNINNIFEFYSQTYLKALGNDLSGAALASKNLRLWVLDLINRLKILKGKRRQRLVNYIKYQYQDLSKDELNRLLRNILNQFSINKNGLGEIVKLILAGANVNEKNNYGYTALMKTVIHGYKNIVQLLISNGANVNEKNNWRCAALILAAIYGYKDIVQLLIDNGANVNEKNNYGETALIFAAVYGHKSIVQLLISKAANVNEKNNNGYTALIRAASVGHRDIVELLIGNGARVDEKNIDGYTALMLAASNGHKSIVQLLISKVVNVNEKNNNGETALMLAKKYNHIGVARLFQGVDDKAHHSYNCMIF